MNLIENKLFSFLHILKNWEISALIITKKNLDLSNENNPIHRKLKLIYIPLPLRLPQTIIFCMITWKRKPGQVPVSLEQAIKTPGCVAVFNCFENVRTSLAEENN